MRKHMQRPLFPPAGRTTFLAAIVIAAVLLICAAAARAGETTMPNPLPHPFVPGVREPTAEEAEYLKGKVGIISHVAPNGYARRRAGIEYADGGLPARVVNYQNLPVIGDQGGLGSCASFATCYYYKTYQESKEHGWGRPDPAVNPERVFSPAYCYNLTNNGGDLGGFPSVLTRFIVDHGAATWQDMPYDDNDYISWPSETAWRNGLKYRAASADVIVVRDDAGVADLRQYLANGDISVMALMLYTNFFRYGSTTPTAGIDNEVIFANAGSSQGNHSMAIIGYDDNKTFNDGTGQKSGAFLIVNSWGANWGVSVPEIGTKGFLWMSYDYFKTKTNGLAWVMTDRTNYTPDVIATVGFDHTMRQDLEVYFSGGTDIDIPDWEFQAIYGLGGEYPIKQNLVFDLTQYATSTLDRITLRVFDKSVHFTSGKVTGFRIEKVSTGETYYSGAAPANTVDGQSIRVPIALPVPDLILHAGWNLVGASARGASLVPVTIFATATREIFAYDNGFANRTLDAAIPMEPGRGYWIYSDNEICAAAVGGTAVTDAALQITLNPGWNLISNPWTKPVAWGPGGASMSCGALPTAYLYDNLFGYAPVAPGNGGTLLPWRGYWLKAGPGCTLTLTKPAG